MRFWLVLAAISATAISCSKSDPKSPSPPVAKPEVRELNVLPESLIPDLFLAIEENQNDFVIDVIDAENLARIVNTDRLVVADGEVFESGRVDAKATPTCAFVRTGAKTDAPALRNQRFNVRVVTARTIEADEIRPARKSVTIVFDEDGYGIGCTKPADAISTMDFMWAEVQQAFGDIIKIRDLSLAKDAPLAPSRRCHRQLVLDINEFRAKTTKRAREARDTAQKVVATVPGLESELEKQKLFSKVLEIRELCEEFRRQWKPFHCRSGRAAGLPRFLDSSEVLQICSNLPLHQK